MERFVTDIPRVAHELVVAMHEQSATTVYEAAGQQGGMEHSIRPIAAGMKLCGSALTVRCQPADNLTLHAAIALAQPGDVIVADVDGVVIVPRLIAAEVARLGTDRVAKEEKSREKLRAGELGLDFYGLRSKLTELGVRWIDEP